MTDAQLKKAFLSFFQDANGAFQVPANTGGGRSVVTVCKGILNALSPMLYKTLSDWDGEGTLITVAGQTVSVLDVSMMLLQRHQIEGAWAVAHVYYDQLLKKESTSGRRLAKGHPACGLALIAQAIKARSLCRHYALLSSAGDIYWEHNDPNLKFGGLAPTLLESFESVEHHDTWRSRVRQAMNDFETSEPLYLEAFVAAGWFDSHAEHVLRFAPLIKSARKPFIEVLLDKVVKPTGLTSTTRGTLFEAASGLLLNRTPGFEVESARKSTDDQVDLVVHYTPDPFFSDIGLEKGFGLVECKSSEGRVSAADLRDFGSKCVFHRVNFGILVARSGITKGLASFREPRNAELVRRRFQLDGITILVLDLSHLRGKSWQLRGIQDELKADYRRLVFGDVA
jgi:hypothetical protein